MKTIHMLFVLGVFSICANTPSWATPLPLIPFAGSPEFTGFYVNVVYDYGTSNFQAIGETEDYGGGNGFVSLTEFGSFNLTAIIDHAGVLREGTLTIGGGINYNPVETLLIGSLIPGASGTAFGFADPPLPPEGGGNVFSFLFQITTCNPDIVADNFGGLYGGVNLDAWFDTLQYDIPFDGTWTSSFNNNGSFLNNGSSDISAFIVPEPSSILLMLSGGFLYAAANRGRRKSARVAPGTTRRQV